MTIRAIDVLMRSSSIVKPLSEVRVLIPAFRYANVEMYAVNV
jgi:hypothetical protein